VKGFVCPIGQICQEQSSNPSNNLQSYDNIFYSIVQVIVIASANTVSYNKHEFVPSSEAITVVTKYVQYD
jgi:hypothetical protein